MNEPWSIRLFGGLSIRQSDRLITRFRTQKTGALLAFLAYHRQHSHGREVLIEMLWPDTTPESGRHNLSHALSSLRNLLEPPGVPAGFVIIADRFSVQLNPDAFTTDVAEFEQELQLASQAGAPERSLNHLMRAIALYGAALLPDHYEDWIGPAQERLAQQFRQAATRAISLLERGNRSADALGIAGRAVEIDLLDEEANTELIRLLAETGRFDDGLRQYRQFVRLLQRELGESPGGALVRLAERIEAMSLEKRELGASTKTTADSNAPDNGAEQARPEPPYNPAVPPADPPFERSRLPLQFTRFFGREEEIERIVEILASPDVRLLTLTGAGGTGKTRLCIESAGRYGESYTGPIWFVPLADLTDVTLIPQAVLLAMSVPLVGSREPLEQLALALGSRSTLLILDNFEQLIVGGSELLLGLLSRVATLRCMVTSRQTLGLAGETEFAVAPLPTPNGSDTPERLSLFDSVRLFVDRAQQARPDFRISSRNAPAVAELCDRLEGIPLAIELAAARALVLSPSQMLAQLGNRFEFLVSRKRGIAERQRTLLATVDWSYRLLAPNVQSFFKQLFVFRGGWTFEAAEAVCEEPLALDMLAQLRECSLVTTVEIEGGFRFRMLETLREYAAEQMSAEERDLARNRHAEFYLAVAEEAEPRLKGPEQGVWLSYLETEHDNLRAALSFSSEFPVPSSESANSELGTRSSELGLRLAGALSRFWVVRGHFTEGRERYLTALGAQGAAERTSGRAKALLGLGELTCKQGDYPGTQTIYEETLEIYRELGDNLGSATVLNNLGLVAYYLGDFASARSRYEESLAIFRELGDKLGVANSLGNLGIVAGNEGDYASARSLYEESLAIRRELEDKRGIANSLNDLGILAVDQGDYASARSLYEESLAARRELGDKQGIATSLNNLGNVAFHEGDYGSARSLNDESLAIYRELGDNRGIANSLNDLGILAVDQLDYASARSLLGESLAIYRELGDTYSIAWSLEGLASLAVSQEQTKRAAHLYGAADSLRQDLGAPLPSSELPKHSALVATLRESMGEEVFAAAWEAGQKMTWEQAAEYALDKSGE